MPKSEPDQAYEQNGPSGAKIGRVAWSRLAWPCAESCPTGTSEYEAIRFEYAKNGEAVSFALGETWCWDGVAPVPPAECATVENYAVTWAKEFRYDGARRRYAVYDLFPGALMQGSLSITGIRWSHYDAGNNIYADVGDRQFEAGVARVDPVAPVQGGNANTMYYHTDHLGTTRLMTDASGKAGPGWYDSGQTQDDVLPAVYSAFGERISTTDPYDDAKNRYGYVGGLGYQAHDANEMRFLHVGHRYYDPGGGRFLQRDPVGIRSGANTYVYVGNIPTIFTDPLGLVPPGKLQRCQDTCDKWYKRGGVLCGATSSLSNCYNSCDQGYWPWRPPMLPVPPPFKPWPGDCPPCKTGVPSPDGGRPDKPIAPPDLPIGPPMPPPPSCGSGAAMGFIQVFFLLGFARLCNPVKRLLLD